MGFCSEHGTVYEGDTCPECSGRTESRTGQIDGTGMETENEKVASEAEGAEPEKSETSPDEIELSGEGDVVTGTQNKQVDKKEVTEVDEASVEVDESTTKVDESTEIKDSVVNRSEIRGEGESKTTVEDSVLNRSTTGEKKENDGMTETKFCIHCGAEIDPDAEYCTDCGEKQE